MCWEGVNLYRKERRAQGLTEKRDGDENERGGLLWSRGQVRGMRQGGLEKSCRWRERVGMNWGGHCDCRDSSRKGARTVHWDCRCPSRGWDWQRQGWDDRVFYEEQETWCRLPLKLVVSRCRRTHARTRALLQGAIGRTAKTRPKKVRVHVVIYLLSHVPIDPFSST